MPSTRPIFSRNSLPTGCTGLLWYGFNGKEKDNDIAGDGNTYDYGFRIYDARLARFLSVDPLTSKYPFYTPYQFSGNKPISCLDLDGLEDIYYLSPLGEMNGKTIMDILTSTEIGAQVINEFKNTDPTKGKVNAGYDVYLRPVTLKEMQQDDLWGGVVRFGKKDETMFIMGQGPQEYPLLEAIIKAREDKNSIAYEKFAEFYGEDFVNDPNLEKTLENKRGFIIIAITPGATDAETNIDAASEAASTTGHEFMNHGNEVSQTEELPNATRQNQQHLKNTGNIEGNKASSDSRQGKLNKQINDKKKK